MTIMRKMKKSHLYDQAKLKYLADILCDDIDRLLEVLGVESYKNLGKMISMSCPIHGGDNDTALNIYHQGDHYRGNWKCRTHHCEEIFKGSIIGFIRGCLSHNSYGWQKSGDQVCSFKEALDFATMFSEQDLDKIKISKKHREKTNFVNTVKYISNNSNKLPNVPAVSRASVQKNLSIPSQYFINRGFSKEILIKYDVGDCLSSDKEMYGRAVVPIYNDSNEFMVGCTGRSIYTKCDSCKSYHSDKEDCPLDDKVWKYSKWKHNFGFKTQDYLYNYGVAKDVIKDKSSVVIVESPGNVWRLSEAGIMNAVAIFGSSLADRQKMILDSSGAMTIITIMDNDEAGHKAAQQIAQKCSKTYNIINISIKYEDIAAMTVSQIQEEIYPLIKDYV